VVRLCDGIHRDKASFSNDVVTNPHGISKRKVSLVNGSHVCQTMAHVEWYLVSIMCE
jgi:hypothetical protein